jgi:hypothetical protein
MPDRRGKAIGFGVALLVVGLVLAWSGLAPLSEYWGARDGYFMSNPLTVDRSSQAVIAEDADLLRGRYETLSEETFVLQLMGEPDDVRVQAAAASTDGVVFIGIAPTAAVDAYLDEVAHDEIVEWDTNLANITDVEYTSHDGTATPGRPDSETFWVASATGAGEQTLDWTIEQGEWTFVAMNGDASSGVAAELRFGTLVPAGLNTIAWAVFIVGLIALIGGGVLLYLAAVHWGRKAAPADGVDPAHRSSLRDLIRPGHSLVLFPAIVASGWALLVAVAAAAFQLMGPDRHGGSPSDVLGAAIVNFGMAFVLAFAVSAIVRATGGRGTDTDQ